jgi:hypothetical protein
MSTKVCSKCREEKPLDMFSKDSAKKDKKRSYCRPCDSKKASLWGKNNPERKSVNARKASKNYRTKNPEKVQIDNSKFRSLNPEYGKNWRKTNPEKSREYSKRHYSKGLKKALERNRKRRALLAATLHSPYTELDVLATYGTDCYLCNKPIDLTAPRWTKYAGWEQGLHIEHVVDVALGGPNVLENVRPSHGLCNLQKTPNKKE